MFPSPLGVIFSLILVPLSLKYKSIKFPSPLGVIFSLIGYIRITTNEIIKRQFPSPLGVIFSLIILGNVFWTTFSKSGVSVSSRSYILSY